MAALYETLRPKKLSDVVGFKPTITALQSMIASEGLAGQCLWFTGGSGQGKTTVSRILASMFSSDWTIVEVDAQDVTMEMVREWEAECRSPVLGGGGYSYIINEAHGMSSKVVSRLQTVLESKGVLARGLFIFTTTFKGQRRLFDDKFDSVPFMSRAKCLEFKVDAETVESMVRYLIKVANDHNLGGKPASEFIELVKTSNANMRQCIQAISIGKLKA